MKLKLSMSKAQRLAQKGFTLLELLIVVAILAIIGGGLIAAYDGLQTQAAKSQASHTIASLDQAVRTYTTVTKASPNKLDSLVAITGSTTALPTNHPAATDGALAANLPSKLAGKMSVTKLSNAQGAALAAAGITTLRYLDKSRNAITGADTTNILNADIPNRVFDEPLPSATANRGRGFSLNVDLDDSSTTAGADPVVAVWNKGDTTLGENNTKVGAAATDVLVAVGLGNNSTMVNDQPGEISNVNLSAAPNYPDVKKNEYNRYILLYNIGPAAAPRAKAKLQAVLDTRGDFLDEELAEASGQKQ